MEDLQTLVGFMIIGLAIRWVVITLRLRRIEKRLREEIAKREASEDAIRELTRRVWLLEKHEPAAAPPPVPAPEPVFATPLPPPPVREPEPPAIPVFAQVETAPPPPVEPLPPPVPPPPPGPTLGERLRAQIGDEGWEAMVGGNMLNKLGVLLLVVGIALLLGYEFTRVGPFGRIAIGLGVSLTMLIGGVVVERRPAYSVFGRGLIGGGWAALYFTTYAMHAVGAARIVGNAYLASILLLAVAACMIVHSLRYRSQTVSGMAYFIAFGTLALADNTPFSVLALIPLAATLLVLAHRFSWYKMAVFGLLATYATCASRPDSGAPLASTQALFACYWLLFESFDLLSLRRRPRGLSVESAILPLNALGFLGLSLVKWHRVAPERLYLLLAAGAAAYLADALLRARIDPPRETEPLADRIAAGGFESPMTLSAALAAVALFRKATGIWLETGLLVEGELLFLAGVRFGQLYLRQLGAAVFAAQIGALLGREMPAGTTIGLAGRSWANWTPVALATALVFYGNRALRVAEGWGYSSVAAGLVSLVLTAEVPVQWVPVAGLIWAAMLFEFGFRRAKIEFLYQSYAIGGLATLCGLLLNVAVPDPSWHRMWLPIAILAAIHYALSLRIHAGPAGRVSFQVPWATAAASVGFLLAALFRAVPNDYRGIAWLALGALTFELGYRGIPPQFRRLSYAASAAGAVWLLHFDVLLANKTSGPAQAISLGAAAALCALMTARVFPALYRIEDAQGDERDLYRDLTCAVGAVFYLVFAWLKLPAAAVALAWTVAALAILEIGFVFRLSRFRFLGNTIALAAFGRLFLANFTNTGSTLGVSHRVLTVAPLILSEYFIWARYRTEDVTDKERFWPRLYLYAPAILVFVLMRFELGRSMAVVGWALFGLALYRTGLRAKIADLRWQSFALAAAAFARCWATNFYIPGSLGGIRERVLTGIAVVACFYAAQILAPREPSEDCAGPVDRYARTFYSMLASVLLAVLLFYEVSGSVLTVAWSLEALALLAAGFPLRDRLQRLSGLALFLMCVLKLFFYDLRQLETVSRILSFIVLGALLVAVSWIYTRFRDRIQRYL